MFSYTRGQIIAASIIVALALFGTGFLAFRSASSAANGKVRFLETTELTAESPSSDASGSASPAMAVADTIRVQVAGQVKSPGVYDLHSGSRVEDAIKAAGGAANGADLESINLVEKLSDGQQVYIVLKGVVPPPTRSIVRSSVASRQVASVAKPMANAEQHRERSEPEKFRSPDQGKVNINTASIEDLQRLPGIGPAMAQRIVEYRSGNGRFESVDELDEIKGIGSARLGKLRPFVSL